MCQILLHFFCVAECVVLFCFVFFVNRIFLVMQLLRHSSICKLVCTLNCSVGCSLDHSLGCILEYSLGCSLGCNLDCNQDRFLNYNVDCNEMCNMKTVMQRKQIIQKKKRKPMVDVQYRTQMMFNMKMYVSNPFTFFLCC